MKQGKRYVEAAKLVDSSKQYEVKEALELIEKVGLKVTQAHAPWRYPPKETTEEEEIEFYEQFCERY